MKRSFISFLFASLFLSVPAHAAGDWSGWWLPTNYSRHGIAIDSLFDWILWITIFIFALVQIALVVFSIRYRHRPNTKARFIKGSAPLELIWTIIPTLILAGLALASTKVWDNYRSLGNDANAANILVIGQQFKWNIIYPGKNGKFGRYLIYPKPTDRAWPHKPADLKHFFLGVPGPASLPYAQAVAAIDQFISQSRPEFQLGKDLSDPDGVDDDYENALGRTLFLPVNRQVHIEVLSRDVIHDFYLPNFRVQLYAVPGMAGSFTFTPTKTTAQIEAETGHPAHLEALCAQLCGIGHATMKTDIVILSQEEYHRRFELENSKFEIRNSNQ